MLRAASGPLQARRRTGAVHMPVPLRGCQVVGRTVARPEPKRERERAVRGGVLLSLSYRYRYVVLLHIYYISPTHWVKPPDFADK